MSLYPYLMDPSGDVARAEYEARLRAAALERLARAGQPMVREQIAGLLVALAIRLAPSLGGSVPGPARRAASIG